MKVYVGYTAFLCRTSSVFRDHCFSQRGEVRHHYHLTVKFGSYYQSVVNLTLTHISTDSRKWGAASQCTNRIKSVFRLTSLSHNRVCQQMSSHQIWRILLSRCLVWVHLDTEIFPGALGKQEPTTQENISTRIL